MKSQPNSRMSRLGCGSFLLTAGLLWSSAGPVVAAAEPASGHDARATANLPVSEIILYSSGVGYFERSGPVDGRSSVELRFKTDDINDLLKSMVVQDLGGGQISSVTYDSRDPLTKTLRSFGIDLTSNPTLGQLLNQVRGERVEILRPSPLVGTILGVEPKTEQIGENRTIETEYLNLVTPDGLQSFPLAQIQRIKLLNENLNAELRQALEVLATGLDTQKKSVTIAFDGEGKREARIAYIAQTPVWKTSYRLVLDEKEPPFLQGWAIVENTSDENWDGVRLSLISGRPISFTMDLYQPLYSTRPEVQPELYTSLRPQVYSDSLDQKSRGMALELMPRAAPAPSGARFATGIGGGGVAGLAEMPSSRPGVAAQQERLGRTLARRNGAAELGDSLSYGGALFARSAVAAAAEGAHAGELFQYVIKTPVSLARQKSAMLPIVSQGVEGQKVSIYNQSVQAKYPLNGFRLKNSTPLHLMQGPITVFDGGAYAGDARVEDLAAGQDRLISYALDIKTEVEPQSASGEQQLTAVRIRKGTLVATRKASEEKTYQIRNRDQKPKTLLIEHPFRSDWELIAPKEPDERTRELYRFRINVDPDKSAKLVVVEEKQLTETVQLVNSAADLIAFYVRSRVVSPKVKDALERVAALRDRLNRTAADRERREQRVQEIGQEQSRIRENMTRLNQSSELYTRYVKKLDEQENELENLRQQIESLKATELKQRQELNDYLLNLDVS